MRPIAAHIRQTALNSFKAMQQAHVWMVNVKQIHVLPDIISTVPPTVASLTPMIAVVWHVRIALRQVYAPKVRVKHNVSLLSSSVTMVVTIMQTTSSIAAVATRHVQ